MKKKTTKAQPAGKRRTVEQSPIAPAPVKSIVTAPAGTSQPTATAVTKPALMRTRLRTPAQRSAAELIRFLKIHAKRAYGPRGQRAILDLAQRVTREAQEE